jgi:hypothetical protein
MDVVYIVKEEKNYDELKYSLRSIERFMEGIDNVYIIGPQPKWLGYKAIHFYFEDNPAYNKERRIMEKIKFACSLDMISENFVLMNDDYFLLSPLSVDDIKYQHSGLLKNVYIGKPDTSKYRRALSNTEMALCRKGLDCKHFDVHTPIVYSKKLFTAVMNMYHWDTPYSFVVRSLYCNTLKIEGELIKDVKLRESFTEDQILGLPMFSSGIFNFQANMINYLDKMFPEPSSYEI